MDWKKTYRRQRRQVVSRAKGATWSEQRFHRDLWRELVAQAEAAGMLNRLTVALIAEIALWDLSARRYEDRLHAAGAFASLSAKDLESFRGLAAMRDRCRELLREFYAICGVHVPATVTRLVDGDFGKGARHADAGAPGPVTQASERGLSDGAPEVEGGGEAKEMTPEEAAARLDEILLTGREARLDARIRAMSQAGQRDYGAALEQHICARRKSAA